MRGPAQTSNTPAKDGDPGGFPPTGPMKFASVPEYHKIADMALPSTIELASRQPTYPAPAEGHYHTEYALAANSAIPNAQGMPLRSAGGGESEAYRDFRPDVVPDPARGPQGAKGKVEPSCDGGLASNLADMAITGLSHNYPRAVEHDYYNRRDVAADPFGAPGGRMADWFKKYN